MSETYVRARGLSKAFDGKTVLDNVSCDVEPGDVIGVLGKNGAGKTTLLELMLGFTPPSAGSVTVLDHESYRMPAAIKARIGFVPQQDELIHQLTAADQLRVIRSFHARWDHDLIERLVSRWEIAPKQRIKSMSVGQRQKLSILLALGHRPDLVLLDEPVASLDPLARRHFLEQIVDIAADGDRAVVLSSHIVSDIERLANKIWILKDNGLYWRGDFDSLKESIVRVHLRSSAPIDTTRSIPNALSVEYRDSYATAVVHDWTDMLGTEIAELTGAELEPEPLTLEDIFLELHR
jgi:ABC-2 type transport system ATP-binding protein